MPADDSIRFADDDQRESERERGERTKSTRDRKSSMVQETLESIKAN